MADGTLAPAATVLEGPGRYVVYEAPDGGWVIARAGNLCENCTGCKCGEQGEPITIPAFAIAMARTQGRARLGALLKAAAGRG